MRIVLIYTYYKSEYLIINSMLYNTLDDSVLDFYDVISDNRKFSSGNNSCIKIRERLVRPTEH